MGTNTLNKLIEAKRDAIAKRAKEAMTNLKKGLVKKGTVKDLYKDLEDEEVLLTDIGTHDEVY